MAQVGRDKCLSCQRKNWILAGKWDLHIQFQLCAWPSRSRCTNQGCTLLTEYTPLVLGAQVHTYGIPGPGKGPKNEWPPTEVEAAECKAPPNATAPFSKDLAKYEQCHGCPLLAPHGKGDFFESKESTKNFCYPPRFSSAIHPLTRSWPCQWHST